MQPAPATWIRSAPAIKPADLHAVEEAWQIAMPADYRSFLLTTNGGFPGPALRTRISDLLPVRYSLAADPDEDPDPLELPGAPPNGTVEWYLWVFRTQRRLEDWFAIGHMGAGLLLMPRQAIVHLPGVYLYYSDGTMKVPRLLEPSFTDLLTTDVDDDDDDDNDDG